MESPKSLTAVIHVRFNYKEAQAKPVDEGQVEIMGQILDKAEELPSEYQEMLVRFANYMQGIGKKG